MVEALLNKETDDAVGVEEKIAAAGVLVPDDRVQSLELGCLWEGEDGGWQRGWCGLGGGSCFEDHGRCVRRRGGAVKGEEKGRRERDKIKEDLLDMSWACQR